MATTNPLNTVGIAVAALWAWAARHRESHVNASTTADNALVNLTSASASFMAERTARQWGVHPIPDRHRTSSSARGWPLKTGTGRAKGVQPLHSSIRNSERDLAEKCPFSVLVVVLVHCV